MFEAALEAGPGRRRRRRAADGPDADAGRRAPDALAARRRRHRDLRLAQPAPRQRHQVLLGAKARSSTTRPNWRSRPRSSSRSAPCRPNSSARRVRTRDAVGRYVEACKNSRAARASTCGGMRIALDCANGATYQIAPLVLRELGARVDAIGVDPNGLNINDGVGSTHPEALVAHVRATGADLGIAFDGDGDRVLFVDGDGTVLRRRRPAVRARHRLAAKRPPARPGGRHADDQLRPRAARSASAASRSCAPRSATATCTRRWSKHDGVLGGEASGHLLCLDRASTGDGIVSALQVLEVLRRRGVTLREALAGMRKVPQKTDQRALAARRQARRGPAACRPRSPRRRRRSPGRGRAFLRPSGTEPVVRVTVEADDAALVQATARQTGRRGARRAAQPDPRLARMTSTSIP